MSWTDLASAFLVIVGVILFLYGANYYDTLAGWGGIGLALSGIVVYIVVQTCVTSVDEKSG